MRTTDALDEIIRDEIARDGPLTFARFMELALYHPQFGYYAGGGAGREPLGWSGDYYTSGDLHPLWGQMLARQLHQIWDLLERPARFDVLEPGAGRGLLALEVWRYARERAPDWAAALRYTLADRAPVGSPLRTARAEQLARALAVIGAPADAVRWVDDAAQAFEARSLVGAVVSNELVDALPVHLLQARGGTLVELYVAVEAASGRLVEVAGPPSSAEVAGYLDRFGIGWRTFPDGWRAEVCLAAEAWLRRMAELVGRGLLLTIDYGDRARRLYSRERYRGTLAVYARHQVGARPLGNPGQQDLTAHVNFSGLMQAGRAAGVRLAGFTTQAAFLERLGIRAEAEALAARLYPAADSERHTDRGQADYLRRATLRHAVAALLDPAGMGGFKVLAQQRGLPGVGRRLRGLAGD